MDKAFQAIDAAGERSRSHLTALSQQFEELGVTSKVISIRNLWQPWNIAALLVTLPDFAPNSQRQTVYLQDAYYADDLLRLLAFHAIRLPYELFERIDQDGFGRADMDMLRFGQFSYPGAFENDADVFSVSMDNFRPRIPDDLKEPENSGVLHCFTTLTIGGTKREDADLLYRLLKLFNRQIGSYVENLFFLTPEEAAQRMEEDDD